MERKQGALGTPMKLQERSRPAPADDSPTVSLATGVERPESEAVPERQFLPGTRFGKRYRIVERLGRGGMGEVYRADDLHLGQPVALKFLPQEMTDDPSALARLRNEVRVARQISHANVCRVYDIGEEDGQFFLSMEYIDGEDLLSVLRRLGRPTREKSTELARQLCAGLAAAHDAGVLHRDLKPANIMIDGRGRVRIADFGLAGFARELPLQGFAGTPAYMAPEMFTGSGTSARTDIYALGAVLYELFTGERAFDSDTISGVRRMQEASSLKPPSQFVPDLEPVVEEIILRCLDADPLKRPLSALAVASVLPGGDPVAAALAAGQTPSPEMVAAAGGKSALKPTVAVVCLIAIVGGIASIAALNRHVALYGLAPPDKPAVVIADRGREILDRLGYPGQPADTAYNWEIYHGLLEHIEQTDPRPDRWSALADLRPPVYWLWYRESPVSLAPRNTQHEIRFYDPPLTVPGMAGLKLDDRGRLAVLVVVPPQVHDAAATTGPVDYGWLFEAAGLDPADFTPVEPRWNPRVYADERAAWTGHYPEQPDWGVRVEAASYAGLPIYFNVLEGFDEPWTGPPVDERPVIERSADWVNLALLAVALIIPPLLGRRNLRRGNGDRAGAVRLGVTVWALALAGWALWADHTSSIKFEVEMLLTALGMSLLLGVWSGLVYLALEPYVRRLWPGTMISWTRLLMGRFRDPRVGRDVLLGGLAGVLVIVIQRVEWFVPGWLGSAPRSPHASLSVALLGGRKVWGTILEPSVLLAPLLLLLTLTVLLFLLRRNWLAAAGTLVVWVIMDGHWAGGGPAIVQIAALAETVVVWAILLFTLIRLGLLAVVAAFFFLEMLQKWPLTLDTSVWFSGSSLIAALVLAAIAVVATRTSLGREPTVTPFSP